MSAFDHTDYSLSGILPVVPRFSFIDIAEIVQPAPVSYEIARQKYQRWEQKMGGAYFEHNAELAYQFWQTRRPWWLDL